MGIVRRGPGPDFSGRKHQIRSGKRRAAPRSAARGLGQARDRPGAADPARRQHAPGRRRDPGENLPAIAPGISGTFPHHRAAPCGAHAGDRGPTARPRRAIGAAERSRHRRAADCLLIDTTGELRDWYSVATIVFMGKSLTARGGQNPVEAIVADRPVIFGPHMENFAALARTLVAAGGALQPNDEVGPNERAGRLCCVIREIVSASSATPATFWTRIAAPRSAPQHCSKSSPRARPEIPCIRG